MKKENKVFIAASLDGYIAGKNGEIDWLDSVPNPEGIDMGYGKFIESVDALLMGRISFETVCNFDVEWPYTIPVYVLSRTLESIPEKYKNKVELVKGSLQEVLATIHQKGHHRLYIDGGNTIQNFLKEDLIDEMIITTFPIVLGGGFSLFGELPNRIQFEHVESQVFLNELVQDHYRRKIK